MRDIPLYIKLVDFEDETKSQSAIFFDGVSIHFMMYPGDYEHSLYLENHHIWVGFCDSQLGDSERVVINIHDMKGIPTIKLLEQYKETVIQGDYLENESGEFIQMGQDEEPIAFCQRFDETIRKL